MAGGSYPGRTQGIPGRPKKRLEDSAFDLVFVGATSDPYLAKIILAQMINRVSGHGWINPLELGQLSDTWVDAFRAMDQDFSQAVNIKRKTEDIFSSFERKHKYKWP